MANCPHCQTEYTPDSDQEFCNECGKKLASVSTAPDTEAVESPEEQPAPPSQVSSSTSGGVRTTAVGEHIIAGQNVTVHQGVEVEYCTSGAERIYGGRSFRCPRCSRSPVCPQHYDEERKLCTSCIEEQQTVACSICGRRVPPDQVFTCGRCRRIAGNDHLDPDRNWCTDCTAQWAGVVEAIAKDEVVITTDGAVSEKDQVELVDRSLRTKDGKPVATIKENIWYARPKQWHRVKPKLLRREQQAMRRFYPKMKMSTTGQEDLCWEGAISTWSGNEYQVLVRYPNSFPYLPPKAFIAEPKIEKSRHIYEDGHLCLFHKDDKTWQPETTAATVMSWVSLWLHCYEVWQETGEWPRREHDQIVVAPAY
jgi:ubiquitin-protein ligase